MRNPQVSGIGAYPMLNILPLDATIVQLDPDAGMLASDVIEDAGQEMGCHTLVGGQSNHASKQLRTRRDDRVGKPEDLARLGDGAGPDLRWRRACSGTVQRLAPITLSRLAIAWLIRDCVQLSSQAAPKLPVSAIATSASSSDNLGRGLRSIFVMCRLRSILRAG